MTIDEAQIMLKAKAKCIERICKGIYEDCNEQKCDNCDLCYAQGTNGEQIELMLQCAEWLEELKALREEKSDFQIMAKDIAEGNYEMGMENGYNEAIDDAKSVILQTLDNEILVDTLHLRLEQLKEKNNDKENKSSKKV